jgi:mono/diheme cytochrome c family protein
MSFSIPKIAMIAVFVLAAVGAETSERSTVPGRWFTEAQVEAGRALYAENCAECHGADGGATADWRTPGPDGHYPPPPLNGTGHTWHHSLAQIDSSIADGGAQFGGVMPGFGATLNDSQRLSIIAFIQNWWSDEIYTKWQQIDRRGR